VIFHADDNWVLAGFQAITCLWPSLSCEYDWPTCTRPRTIGDFSGRTKFDGKAIYPLRGCLHRQQPAELS